MNQKKVIFNTIFKNLFNDTVTIKYWDGDTITYGSGKPQFEIAVNNNFELADFLKHSSLAFGEAYMDGNLKIQGNLKELIESIYNNKDSFLNTEHNHIIKTLKYAMYSLKRSKKDIEYHYDIGNDFYELWLDKTLSYSCAYFKTASDSLEDAQTNKIDYILKKLWLKEGDTLLDIGCGWGALIITAAQKYGVKSLGITLSEKQYIEVKKRIKEHNLEDLVDVKLIDYRELKNEKFDKIVSIGMLEHVGKENLNEYFSKIYELLNDKSLSLVHLITAKDEGGSNEWISKYIFPNGYIFGVKEVVDNIAKNGFLVKDMESLRQHYVKTLECWAKNFENALDAISITKDEKFIRMWRLYLNACSASFNVGNTDLHQILFSKGVINNLPWTRDYMYETLS